MCVICMAEINISNDDTACYVIEFAVAQYIILWRFKIFCNVVKEKKQTFQHSRFAMYSHGYLLCKTSYVCNLYGEGSMLGLVGQRICTGARLLARHFLQVQAVWTIIGAEDLHESVFSSYVSTCTLSKPPLLTPPCCCYCSPRSAGIRA